MERQWRRKGHTHELVSAGGKVCATTTDEAIADLKEYHGLDCKQEILKLACKDCQFCTTLGGCSHGNRM